MKVTRGGGGLKSVKFFLFESGNTKGTGNCRPEYLLEWVVSVKTKYFFSIIPMSNNKQEKWVVICQPTFPLFSVPCLNCPKFYPMRQFHQHLTRTFFVQNSFEQLFSAMRLALNKLLYKKCTRKMLMELTPVQLLLQLSKSRFRHNITKSDSREGDYGEVDSVKVWHLLDEADDQRHQ